MTKQVVDTQKAHEHWIAEFCREEKQKKKKARETLVAFCEWIEHNHPDIHQIVAEYYGGGDEGAIEDAYCNNVNKDKLAHDPFTLYRTFIGKPDIIEDYEFDNVIMDNLTWDWIHNEGGFGTAILTMPTRSLYYNHTQLENVDRPETVDLRK